jgi:homogentisate 1,2-dioxygenase
MLNYQSGFGNNFVSEAINGVIPNINSPQKMARGLYAEQLSGSAFTMPRHQNLHVWMYKITPSVIMGDYKPKVAPPNFLSTPVNTKCPPNQMRWSKLAIANEKIDFIESFFTIALNGDTAGLSGSAIHIYRATKSMNYAFYNADGEFLIVPQQGRLLIKTELGELEVEPLEIALIPRGMKFQIILLDDSAYGYVNENYGSPFELPQLGPIGANGLAYPRHFLAPVAKYENTTEDYEIVCKFEGEFWSTTTKGSPFNVVAWHGNYVPYKYNLTNFQVIGSISFDHPDPSIFTVLTSASTKSGMANLDFVAFAPRWLVQNNTFRPPYFHRNIMSEFMGLIEGTYDAKLDGGFVPGGSSIHNRFTPHGPDSSSTIAAMKAELTPKFLDNTMSFMFESFMPWRVTAAALNSDKLQSNYLDAWQGIPNLFKA